MPALTHDREHEAGWPDADAAFGGPGMVSADAHAAMELTCGRDHIWYMLRTWAVWGAEMGV